MIGRLKGNAISHDGTHEKNFGRWFEASKRNAEAAAKGMESIIVIVTSAPK